MKLSNPWRILQEFRQEFWSKLLKNSPVIWIQNSKYYKIPISGFGPKPLSGLLYLLRFTYAVRQKLEMHREINLHNLSYSPVYVVTWIFRAFCHFCKGYQETFQIAEVKLFLIRKYLRRSLFLRQSRYRWPARGLHISMHLADLKIKW